MSPWIEMETTPWGNAFLSDRPRFVIKTCKCGNEFSIVYGKIHSCSNCKLVYYCGYFGSVEELGELKDILEYCRSKKTVTKNPTVTVEIVKEGT